MSNAISKIAVKTVFGSIDVRLLKDGYVMPIMRVIGQTKTFKTGLSDKGNWVAFIGAFEATNAKTGEVFVSGKFFPPSTGLVEMLQGAVDLSQGPVDVAFDIAVKYEQTAATKYVYVITPLLAPSVADPLAALRNQLQSVPALAAPKDQTTGATPAAKTTSASHTTDTKKKK